MIGRIIFWGYIPCAKVKAWRKYEFLTKEVRNMQNQETKKDYYMQTIVIIRYENSYILSVSVITRV
jgi:hypothetical protein